MNLVSFILLAVGVVLLFDLKLSDIPEPKLTLKQQVKKTQRKEEGFIAKQLTLVIGILKWNNVPRAEISLLLACALCACVGAGIGVSVGNLFLIPVLVLGCAVLPVIGVRLWWNINQKQFDDKLEATLHMITSSYLRGNNTFARALEESMPNFDDSMKSLFQKVLSKLMFVNTNTVQVLEELKITTKNKIFVQWIDAVIRCQSNQTLKHTLPKILDEFENQNNIDNQMSAVMAEPKSTFYIMLVSGVGAPFILGVVSSDWANIMLYNTVGQFLLAAQICTVGIAFVIGMIVLFPIDDERSS